MDTAAYIQTFERTVDRLPSLLARWEEISETLREHYIDELNLLLATRPPFAELDPILAQRLVELDTRFRNLMAEYPDAELPVGSIKPTD